MQCAIMLTKHAVPIDPGEVCNVRNGELIGSQPVIAGQSILQDLKQPTSDIK